MPANPPTVVLGPTGESFQFRSGDVGLAAMGRECRGADVAVAIPLGLSAAQSHTVTFTDLVERVRAAIDADEFAPGDPTAVAYHVWATKHGYVMLEVARMNGRTAKEAEAIYAAGMTRLFDGLARTT